MTCCDSGTTERKGRFVRPGGRIVMQKNILVLVAVVMVVVKGLMGWMRRVMNLLLAPVLRFAFIVGVGFASLGSGSVEAKMGAEGELAANEEVMKGLTKAFRANTRAVQEANRLGQDRLTELVEANELKKDEIAALDRLAAAKERENELNEKKLEIREWELVVEMERTWAMEDESNATNRLAAAQEGANKAEWAQVDVTGSTQSLVILTLGLLTLAVIGGAVMSRKILVRTTAQHKHTLALIECVQEGFQWLGTGTSNLIQGLSRNLKERLEGFSEDFQGVLIGDQRRLGQWLSDHCKYMLLVPPKADPIDDLIGGTENATSGEQGGVGCEVERTPEKGPTAAATGEELGMSARLVPPLDHCTAWA